LFVLDTDLQSSIISKKDKQINFKKLMLNGSDVILAFYSGEDDFHAPIFKSIEEAGSYMQNNKIMIIPLKEKKKVFMSLQIVFNVNMKVNEVKKGGETESQIT